MKNAIPGLGGPSSSVAEGGVQIRGQLTFSATCHSRLKLLNLREMDLLKQRSLYMVLLRPEVSSVCLINFSFHCAVQPLPGASHLLLAEEKGWDLTEIVAAPATCSEQTQGSSWMLEKAAIVISGAEWRETRL